MIAAVFPGQGSQKPGMGEELYRQDTYARQVFDQVEHATGINVALLCFEADENTLKQTQNAQLALYTCGLAAFYSLHAALPSLKFDCMAGHSVGEYTALAAAGVLSVQQGAVLVQKRGQLMASAGSEKPGTMAAVLGMDADDLQAVLDKEHGGICVIANDNCPGQLVISGDLDAVQRASVAAVECGAKRVIPLSVSGAFHSPLMAAASDELAETISKVTFHAGAVPVYSNVLATPGSDWPFLLKEQLQGRVRWTESMQRMIADGATTFVEFGPGEVLSGLLKRIDRSVTSYVVVDPITRDETAGALK